MKGGVKGTIHKLLNISTYQQLNISTFQHINVSTYQHINVSTTQHINNSALKAVYITDTIPLTTDPSVDTSKIKVISMTGVFARIIRKIYNYEPISSEFIH